MHITYDIKIVRDIDAEFDRRKKFFDKRSAKEKVENFMKDLEDKVEQNRKEQAIITETSAQFGCYLKKNAITPFNDHILSHLEMEIKLEREAECSNQRKMEQLKAVLAKYEAKKKLIDKAMLPNSSSAHIAYITSPDEVDEKIKELFKLPINGKHLENAFKGVQQSRDDFKGQEVFVDPIKKNKGSLFNAISETMKKGLSSMKKNYYS